MKVAVSLLSTGFKNLIHTLALVDTADEIHIDIMDGKFVKEKTINADIVKEIQTPLTKDVHLMIEKPEEYYKDYIKAGADIVTFHVEASYNPSLLIEKIQSTGRKAGIALNPETSVETIINYAGKADRILIMSVHPGRGSQKFISTTLNKLNYLRRLFPAVDIAIDGGISDVTAKRAVKAGANILVSGSYIFKSKNPRKVIELLKMTNF